MHRVELKVIFIWTVLSELPSFLMHRVELKVGLPMLRSQGSFSPVPNAPCGVERHTDKNSAKVISLVPNAPCGVERHFSFPQ